MQKESISLRSGQTAESSYGFEGSFPIGNTAVNFYDSSDMGRPEPGGHTNTQEGP